MAELGIDQSKLPGVKEVCRDFAVLEDHTLAHNLQEQEIEHHLATNIQRHRLVQYDLQVAKQLQEEEDRKAHTARSQEHHRNTELQDCEIAQEIQVKLVIEAEQKRRQEEDDEDIARVLQQKELREDKRKKKPPPSEPSRHSTCEEGCYPESRGTKSKGTKEATYHKPRMAGQDLQSYDAEMARKMQEEELWASHVDKRAAQVAQDEEIARLMMAEEKAAYRKAREREKLSSERRRQDQDWKHNTHELVRPRSREDNEGHRPRSDKPTWPPPPPTEDPGHLGQLPNLQNSTYQSSKSESSYKGHHYKQ